MLCTLIDNDIRYHVDSRGAAVSFCQVRRPVGEELRLVLRTFSSISLRWDVLVKCEKFASVVCVAVRNKPKIRKNNWDSKVFFCFHQARKSKQRGKKLRPIHILQMGDRRHITAKIFFLHENRFHARLHPQFTCMIFIYSQLFLHHFTGVFGTNIMNISQLAWLLSWWSVGQAWIFFFLRPYFHYYSNSVHYCEDRRNQSSGKCTDSPTNQFSNTFMINLF